MYWVLMSTILLSTTTLGINEFDLNDILITIDISQNTAICHIDYKLHIFQFLVTSLDCWECKFKSPSSGPQDGCLTSKTNLGPKKRCTNTQPGCSILAAGNQTKQIQKHLSKSISIFVILLLKA